MKGKLARPVVTIKAFEGNSSERRRASHILAFLQTGSKAFACKTSGLSRMAHQRIIQMFIDRGHAFDSERSGRPMAYTAPIMEAGYATLISNEEGCLNGKQLQQKLVKEGVLHPSSDVDVFLRHLHQYVKGQGHRLITNSVKTTFFITLSDVAARVAYAHAMLDELKASKALDNIIFVDEVIVEESPHPKGRK